MRLPAGRAAARVGLVAAWLAVAAAIPAPAAAHIVSDREARALGRLADSLYAVARLAAPDSAGMCGPNRPADFRVSAQVPALRLLALASARADTAVAERAWRAIDAAMAMQRPGGRFERTENGATADTLLGWEDAVDWLAELNRTVAAVMNGPLKARFRFRWALLRPKLERSTSALVRMAPVLERRSPGNAVRLLAMAEAFLLADGHYHYTGYGLAGQRLLSAALAMQRLDGSFAPPSPGAPAGDVRALDALEALSFYFPAPFLDRASARLAKRIETSHRAGGTAAARGLDPETRRLAERTLALRAARLALPPPRPGGAHAQATPGSP